MRSIRSVMSASTVGPLLVQVDDRREDDVVLRRVDRTRRHERITERVDRLGVGGVDLLQVAAETLDLLDRHVRLEVVDHVATERRPAEHLEHERRHDHPDPDDQRSDDRQVPTSSLHDTPVLGRCGQVPFSACAIDAHRGEGHGRGQRVEEDEPSGDRRAVVETLGQPHGLLHREHERCRLRVGKIEVLHVVEPTAPRRVRSEPSAVSRDLVDVVGDVVRECHEVPGASPPTSAAPGGRDQLGGHQTPKTDPSGLAT